MDPNTSWEWIFHFTPQNHNPDYAPLEGIGIHWVLGFISQEWEVSDVMNCLTIQVSRAWLSIETYGDFGVYRIFFK